MKKIIYLFFSALVLFAQPLDLKEMGKKFQHDADLIRLDHLKHWTGLVEEYYKIKGQYPFQNKLMHSNEIGIVKIATKFQRTYLSPGSSNYREKLDFNANNRFKEISVSDFVIELQNVLGKEIFEKYDIQKVPTSSPIGYHYFFTNDGYLIWTTCITCGVTQISTLLYDGYTPTVNIVSQNMKSQVTKALLRDEMLSHPTFKKWISKPYYQEVYVKKLVRDNELDSK